MISLKSRWGFSPVECTAIDIYIIIINALATQLPIGN